MVARATHSLADIDNSAPTTAPTMYMAQAERLIGDTYYCEMPTLRPPEAIWLFSTPETFFGNEVRHDNLQSRCACSTSPAPS